MSHYRSDRRDIEFVLFEVLGAGNRWERAGLDMTTGEASAVLAEIEHWAQNTLAPSFADSGFEPPSLDPATGDVSLPKPASQALRAHLESDWPSMYLPEEVSGQYVPSSLKWAAAEFFIGANPAVAMCTHVLPASIGTLIRRGTPVQRRLGELALERGWTTTMVLTEDDAGSDVGAARTKATEQPDGSWHIEGTKRFITFGDHDASENILHMVLARPSGAGPGTKGLSLFVVPKYLVDSTGSVGERNGVTVTGLAHKMGLYASPTCEMAFGGEGPAVGWLLGDSHDGIRQMFDIIRHVRMMVGVKSNVALSSAYLTALDFARTRVQGTAIDGSPDGPKVPIIEHPDVQRSLLAQKSHTEGMRGLILYTATVLEDIEILQRSASPDCDAVRALEARHALLLPVVKAYCSETAWRLLGTESLATLGGSGYLREYPIEQYVRDTKVDAIYEGTTAIQGLDLFTRRVLRDGGALLGALLDDIRLDADAAPESLRVEADLLKSAVNALGDLVALLVGSWSEGESGIRDAAANTTRLLMGVGDVLCGWQLLRATTVAQPLADSDSFYAARVASARWFARQVLPRLTADVESARLTCTVVTAETFPAPRSC